jgi:hypothetical protein
MRFDVTFIIHVFLWLLKKSSSDEVGLERDCFAQRIYLFVEALEIGTDAFFADADLGGSAFEHAQCRLPQRREVAVHRSLRAGKDPDALRATRFLKESSALNPRLTAIELAMGDQRLM